MGKGVDLNHKLVEFYDGILLGEKLNRVKKAKGGAIICKTAQMKVQEARAKLNAIAQGVPEVMVKVTGGGQGMRQVRNHMDYVSRNGELVLEDQDGYLITGKQDVQELANEWQRSGSFIAEEGARKEAFNIVLSMPPGVDRLAVERAGRDFAATQFKENFQYVFVRHDDEAHPHVHLVVKARGYDGKRLNPRKADLHQWREGFAKALRIHGIEAAATKRQQRLRKEKGVAQAIAHMKERGAIPKTEGRVSSVERVSKAQLTEATVTAGYKEVIGALRQASREDRDLAVALEGRLFGRVGRDISNINRSATEDFGRG